MQCAVTKDQERKFNDPSPCSDGPSICQGVLAKIHEDEIGTT